MPWQGRLRILVRHHFERYRAHPDLGTLLARQPDTAYDDQALDGLAALEG